MAKFNIPTDEYTISTAKKAVHAEKEQPVVTAADSVPPMSPILQNPAQGGFFANARKKNKTGSAKTVYFDKEVLDYLTRTAEENDISFSSAINMIVREFASTHQ